jgi:hypothetical protein
MIQHKVRNGLRSGEVTYSLSDTGLEWHGEHETGSVPYGSVVRLSLETYSADVADADAVHGLLRLRTNAGDRLKIRSHHLRSLGSYESRQGTYAPFVRELSRRVMQANPAAQFTSGTAVMRAIYLGLTICLLILALALTLAWVGAGWSFDLNLGWALAAGGALFSWKKFKETKPMHFDPASVPDHLVDLRLTADDTDDTA